MWLRREPQTICHLRDVDVVSSQQLACTFNSDAPDKIAWRHAHELLHPSMQMGPGDADFVTKTLDAKIVVVDMLFDSLGHFSMSDSSLPLISGNAISSAGFIMPEYFPFTLPVANKISGHGEQFSMSNGSDISVGPELPTGKTVGNFSPGTE